MMGTFFVVASARSSRQTSVPGPVGQHEIEDHQVG
jgi:hypothetical protein